MKATSQFVVLCWVIAVVFWIASAFLLKPPKNDSRHKEEVPLIRA